MVRRKDSPGALFINGKRLFLSPIQAEILACLLEDQGKAVPYKKLCSILGPGRDKTRAKRTLGQHVLRIKEVLAAKKTGYVIAAAHHVGYVLCRIAKPR